MFTCTLALSLSEVIKTRKSYEFSEILRANISGLTDPSSFKILANHHNTAYHKDV